MSMVSNYPLARKSIGKIQYKQKDYEAAKENFYAVNAREDYGLAFEKSRYLFLQKYFSWVVCGLAAAAALLVYLLIHFRRKALQYENDLYGIVETPLRKKEASVNFWKPMACGKRRQCMDDLKLGVLMFFYPVKACALIKRRRDGFRSASRVDFGRVGSAGSGCGCVHDQFYGGKHTAAGCQSAV